jgi:mannosylglycerate hydrolase
MSAAPRPDLAAGARQVLQRNRRAGFTRPGPHLYPHQWSWDAALIAIGYSTYDPAQGRSELRSLFRGQWSNGMVPHIVFSPGLPDSVYFPGSGIWQSARSPLAPRSPATSGIVQPPLHATAVRALHEAAPDRAFLEEMHPRLVAWHEYLHRERDLLGDGLVAIRHPWESGMDNSPVWDEPLARVHVARGAVPLHPRPDLRVAEADERPTVLDYEQYLLLVHRFRSVNYDESALRHGCPFWVIDPQFNAILVRAERDLAFLTRELGADPAPHEQRADRLAAAIENRLWREELGLYLAWDVCAGTRIPGLAAAGAAPLFAEIPSRERARRIAATLAGPHFGAGDDDQGFSLPSFDRRDPAFSRTRYWRGPVWANVNWLLAQGLRAYGLDEEAATIESSLLRVVEGSGFREYWDPDDGTGYGAEEFSWTAALTLELLSAARPAS